MTSAPNIAPGPSGWPIVGNLRELSGDDRLTVFLNGAGLWGDVVRYRLGRTVAHVLRHPDDVRHVLQENAANYTKGRGQKRARVVLGEGLITSEGEFWRRQRRMAQPAFQPKRFPILVESMATTVSERLRSWERYTDGRPFDLANEMMRLALSVVSTALFGTDVSNEADALHRAATLTLTWATSSRTPIVDLPLSLPTPSHLRLRAAIAEVDRIVYRVVAARRARPPQESDKGDLLGMLMAARDEESGESMSDRQLRDEVVTLLGAGYETVANALSWTFYLLSLHPDAFRRVKAEVARVIGDRVPAYSDIARLTATRLVVDESLRLYPPVWMFGRRAIQDDAVRGYLIPAGSLVGISPYLIHRHPDFWPNAEAFDPARFDPETSKSRHRYAYMPFGGGARTCIGNHFAVLEMQVVIAMITQRFQVSLSPGPPVAPEPLFTLRPKGGLRVTLARAERASS